MEWLKNLWKSIIESDNQPLHDRIRELEQENNDLYEEVQEHIELINTLNEEIKEKDILINDLYDANNKLLEKLNTNELEEYWNNKIKKSTVYYYARRNESPQNVLEFFNKNNKKIETITGSTNDVIAKKCLIWVHKNIKYTQKKDKENNGEYWQYANETNQYKTGDCEDGAILMANMMLKSGVPYWRIRINAGDVKGGGHAYVTYLKEKDNKWYVMDWCYWYNSNGKLWKEAEKYFGIWFSFNNKYAFKKDELDRWRVIDGISVNGKIVNMKDLLIIIEDYITVWDVTE